MTGETEQLLRRAEDLARRCVRTASVTASTFLTPAEALTLAQWAPRGTDCTVLLHGGTAEAERKCAFFLPAWMEPEQFDIAEYLCALEITARFGAPGHRDYLGAILGLGIGRDWVGDILVFPERAYVFCLPSVRQHLLLSLDKVGRWGVKVREIPLAEVPVGEKETKELSFTVKSPRLDAVCAGAFGMSRTAAAEKIAAGLVALNYQECLKPDAAVRPGDVLSLRGKGKCTVGEAGDRETKKGRAVVTVFKSV